MPLDGQGKGVFDDLGRLDNAVGCAGDNPQRRCHRPARLMVQTVDLYGGLAEKSRQQAVWLKDDPMRHIVMWLIVLVSVLHRAVVLADILVKCTAARDVEQLQAAADPQERLAFGQRPACQQQLRSVTLLVDAA